MGTRKKSSQWRKALDVKASPSPEGINPIVSTPDSAPSGLDSQASTVRRPQFHRPRRRVGPRLTSMSVSLFLSPTLVGLAHGPYLFALPRFSCSRMRIKNMKDLSQSLSSEIKGTKPTEKHKASREQENSVLLSPE